MRLEHEETKDTKFFSIYVIIILRQFVHRLFTPTFCVLRLFVSSC